MIFGSLSMVRGNTCIEGRPILHEAEVCSQLTDRHKTPLISVRLPFTLKARTASPLLLSRLSPLS